MCRSVLRDRLTVLQSIKFFVSTPCRARIWITPYIASVDNHHRNGQLFWSQPNPLRLYGQVSRAISTG